MSVWFIDIGVQYIKQTTLEQDLVTRPLFWRIRLIGVHYSWKGILILVKTHFNVWIWRFIFGITICPTLPTQWDFRVVNQGIDTQPDLLMWTCNWPPYVQINAAINNIALYCIVQILPFCRLISRLDNLHVILWMQRYDQEETIVNDVLNVDCSKFNC